MAVNMKNGGKVRLKRLTVFMPITIITLVLVLWVRSVPAKSISSFGGPFIVILKEISNCPKDRSGRNLLQTKGIITHNKKSLQDSLFNGIFYVLTPIDDSLAAQVSFASWNPVSGWVPNSFHFMTKRSCFSLFQMSREIIANVLRYCKEKPPVQCPLKKDNYTIENLPTAYKLKSVPAFHYGKWKVSVQFYRKERQSEKEVLTACIQVESHTVPPESVRQTTILEI